jgi:hypothetical protein
MRHRLVGLVVTLIFVMPCLHAQEFKIANRRVQVHGFFSQGFVYTDGNNWLSMNTSNGSGAMTDMGLNVSSQLTDKLRVGAQFYDRNLGQLGQWHPTLDWAVVDYRFTNWFGVRAGKVKTTFGLYNDSQDLDFLHVFALLPQSVYSTDLRDTTIAHTGGDIYGDIALPHRLGELSYTAYAGHRSDSIYSGYAYLLRQWDTYLNDLGGLQYGADLRWKLPIRGLLVGLSRIDQDISAHGKMLDYFNPRNGIVPYFESSKADWSNQFFAEYERGRFRVDGEYRRYVHDQIILNNTSVDLSDVRGWYISGTYRLTRKLSAGSYYSRYAVTESFGGVLAQTSANALDTSQPDNHIYDKVVSARLDVNRFWNLKIEAHFMDGFANAGYPAGFYPKNNVNGFKQNTNALVVKSSFHF